MQIEPLEPRLLLTSANLQNDLLTVEGSARRDRIRITIWMTGTGNSFEVTINGHHQPITGDDPDRLLYFIPRLMIRAGAGDDSLKLWIPLGWLDTTIHGGAGNDKLNVAARGTLAFGDSGDDVITMPNDLDPGDSAFGGDGDDYIAGGDFGCELHGGNGNDTLIGGKGADQLFGDAGN